MKPQLLLAALAGWTAASPLQARQSLNPMTADDLRNGACKEVTFIFARGSTEPGNMGITVGPATCAALQAKMPGQVACQGVGPAYTADLPSNFLPKNTNDVAINEAKSLFELAHTKCPNTKVLAGGYSQGTAVVDNAIQGLSSAEQDQIKGVVLYGFTRNAQDHGGIPNFPSDKVKVYCAVGDMVCDNTLVITASHLSYTVNAPEAAAWLESKL